jgi:N12 class adenine-specific DNA methylase
MITSKENLEAINKMNKELIEKQLNKKEKMNKYLLKRETARGRAYQMGFEVGKQQATKELLEEVKEVFNKWIRNSPFNMMLFDESQREYARKYNEYVEELKVQLSKLGEEQC